MALNALETRMLEMLRGCAVATGAHPSSPLALLIEDAERKQAEDGGDEIAFAQAMRDETLISNARSGVHEVFVNMEDGNPLALDDSADDDRPFCRAEWYEDGGDSSVGIQATACWVLADDQAGTLLEKHIRRVKPLIDAVAVPMIREG